MAKRPKPEASEPTTPPKAGAEAGDSPPTVAAVATPPLGAIPRPPRPAFPSGVTLENLDWVFAHHTPIEDQVDKYNEIAKAAKNLARVILESCSACADRTAAIRLVREARMTANASITLHGTV